MSIATPNETTLQRWMRKAGFIIGVLFIVVMLGTTVRDLVTGVARPYPSKRGRKTPPSARKDVDPNRYWTILALNAGEGLLMSGIFFGMGYLLNRRMKSPPKPPEQPGDKPPSP